ncbi:nucleoside deaminase [Photobacterium halotolerans]|uniref:Nucleoside deaminase n=1 Tax=Photobacterium halotolerans TaxID=265726 RepID=A0A7X5BMB5_9GAMM|nr:nucleoside deaminase [Photobacterium halotolerans]NAW63946.1 nucleoside deaminase [Photobacterium halotolerans]NAX48664.1 nucleoside deaminase [Photobacterium halotolerans]
MNPFLSQAISLAESNVKQGGRPFGAVVVKDEKVIATGVNRMQAECDPTAHAELLALREAGKALKSPRLDGCKVYASGQPCPMCLAAMRMSGVTEIVFAYSNEQAEAFGLSTAAIARELSVPVEQQSWAVITHQPDPSAVEAEHHLYEKWQVANALSDTQS